MGAVSTVDPFIQEGRGEARKRGREDGVHGGPLDGGDDAGAEEEGAFIVLQNHGKLVEFFDSGGNITQIEPAFGGFELALEQRRRNRFQGEAHYGEKDYVAVWRR